MHSDYTMLKGVVILPCKNEIQTVADVINSLRKTNLDLFILGIDDFSDDGTNEKLLKYSDKVISLKQHVSLAEVIRIGLRYAIKMKPDIIIHIDVDGQYDPADLKRLVKPILEDKADLVIGDRKVSGLGHMPFSKRIGNIFFSWLVSLIVKKRLNDTQSGFRVMRYSVAEKLNLVSSFTYTQEEIIKASKYGFRIQEVHITFCKRKNGDSRLIKNPLEYGIRVLFDIARIFFLK